MGGDGFGVGVGGRWYRVIAFDQVQRCDLLTRAERHLVTRLAGGWSTRAIAAERGTSPRTVSNQLRALYRKLGVGSRHELIARLAGD